MLESWVNWHPVVCMYVIRKNYGESKYSRKMFHIMECAFFEKKQKTYSMGLDTVDFFISMLLNRELRIFQAISPFIKWCWIPKWKRWARLWLTQHYFLYNQLLPCNNHASLACTDIGSCTTCLVTCIQSLTKVIHTKYIL